MRYSDIRIKWTPKAIKAIIQMRKEGWTLQRIGEYFDCGSGSIKNVLNRVDKDDSDSEKC